MRGLCVLCVWCLLYTANHNQHHQYKLLKYQICREVGMIWLGNKVVDECNKLPSLIRNTDIIDNFKSIVDSYMNNIGWV